MGVYLSKANTNKESEDGGDNVQSCTRYGVSAMQGWRQGMEDAHITQPLITPVTDLLNREVSLYGVFDGHGGATVSQWIARHMERVLAESVTAAKTALTEKEPSALENTELPDEVVVLCEALQQSFLKLDAEMQSAESREEIKEIFLTTQSKAKEEEPDHGDEQFQPYRTLLSMSSNPRTLLQALLIGSGSRSPTIRMVEQDGEQFFQINPASDDDDEEERFKSSEEETKRESESSKDEKSPVEEQPVQKSASEPQPSANHESGPSATSTSQEPHTPPAAVPADPALIAEEVPAAVSAVPHVDMVEVPDDADQRNSNSEDSSMLTRNTLPAWAPETTGAAAIVAAVVGGEPPYLITANAGDSRCVLCRGGTAIGMSMDHKPHLPDELNRITKAGGTVLAGRVDGNLNLSRTIGDLFYKTNTKLSPEEQKITAFPDVRVVPLTKEDEFVILACDGIWDCISNEEAVKFVRERLGNAPDETKLSKICEELCDFCLADNPMNSDGGIGCDNMTCIIVLLNRRLRETGTDGNQAAMKIYLSPLTNVAGSTDSAETKVTDAAAVSPVEV